jgi:hypothetical protein
MQHAQSLAQVAHLMQPMMQQQPGVAGAVASLLMTLNTSKLLWGATAIVFNLGSRFLITDITPAQQRIFQHPVYKRIVIFCMLFAATRDVLMAAALAGVLIVVLEGLLNETSRFCIIPGARPTLRPPSLLAPSIPAPVIRATVQEVAAAVQSVGDRTGGNLIPLRTS